MKPDAQTEEHAPQLAMDADGKTVHCTGAWVAMKISRLKQSIALVNWPTENDLVFDCSALTALDTPGALVLNQTVNELRQGGKQVSFSGLRPECSTMLQLIASCASSPKSPPVSAPNWLNRAGQRTWRELNNISNMLAFIGETALILLYSLRSPGRIRWRAILHNLQSAGFEALPIVGLLSFLMGLVISYQGADQLQRFGANIFIADLVGLSMLRELSPLLTAIIVAGRSGSAYAAQIGTMKVTEEIDALRTIGITPAELLVLPKLIALVVALPLLTVFSDITGLLGGMIMARSKLDVSFDVFLDRLGDAIQLSSYLTGIGKAPVFAAIIALVGCYQGFQVTGSADSVGRQTTVSVVQAIFLVILSDALFSILFNWLKI
ncbi:MAG: MlaE family lipid ABC transporter permease subunit [Gallionella sp.]|nr:MlaE family lipid ABC transporter permease subunit [Gallionella sp.]